MKAGTNLEKVLESGNFAVTAEAGPPKGSSAEVIRRKGELLRYCCDGVNVTDNQTAIVRMSSLAGCCTNEQKGLLLYQRKQLHPLTSEVVESLIKKKRPPGVGG